MISLLTTSPICAGSKVLIASIFHAMTNALGAEAACALELSAVTPATPANPATSANAVVRRKFSILFDFVMHIPFLFFDCIGLIKIGTAVFQDLPCHIALIQPDAAATAGSLPPELGRYR